MSPLALKIFRILFVITMVLSLTSCGYKDIDKRSFVVTIGIDKADSDDKKYKVMLKIAIPSSDVKMGETEFIISEEESDSMSGAVRMIKTKVDKEIDFSHAKAIILGESIVEEDIEEILDWFIRRRDIQKVAWIGVGKPDAEKVLNLKRKVERLPSNSLFLSFGNSGTESDYIVSEYLFDLRRRVTEKGIDPILPIIELKEDKYFQINHAAVLSTNKIGTVLNPEETKILNLLLNRITKVDVEVKEQEKAVFFVSIDKSDVDYKINIDDTDNPKIQVNIQMEGIIEEDLSKGEDEKLSDYKKRTIDQVKGEVTKLLNKLKDENLDPIGFGLKYRAKGFEKDDWDKWKGLYGEVEFEVNVELTLQGTGLLK